MHNHEAFESTVEAAYAQWAGEMPTWVDALGLVRSTRADRGRIRSFLPRGRQMQLLLLMGLLVALAVALAASVGQQPPQVPHPRQPGTYQDVLVPTGSMVEPRSGPTATRLADDRVLVIGGMSSAGVVASAEIWDPATGEFAAAGSMSLPRTEFTATPLPDGRVLVVGGRENAPKAESLASAELWDPATRSFVPTGSLLEGRALHTATGLGDGRVLVVGGQHGQQSSGFEVLASSEIWDPAAGTFHPGPPLVEARRWHEATALRNGQVLVVGGWGAVSDNELSSVELWDPISDSFQPAGLLQRPIGNPTATALRDGRALVSGHGEATNREGQFELWDPATASFGPGGGVGTYDFSGDLVQLDDDRVLLIGVAFDDPSTDELAFGLATWDPESSSFSGIAPLPQSLRAQSASLLADGRVLLAGGFGDDQPQKTAALYQ